MRAIFLLSILLYLPTLSFAQSQNFECRSEAKLSKADAGSYLSKVQAAYGKLDSFTAEFQQHSYLAALDSYESSAGTVWFKRPGKMRWDYRTPEEQLFVTKDSTLWLYQPVERQLLIDDFKSLFLNDMPVSFILGIGNLSEQFNLISACQGPEDIVLELSPKEADEALEIFRLTVSESGYPTGAQINDLGGNSTSIVFRKFDRSGKFLAKVFEPDFPKGIDITDRRKAVVQ